MMNVTDTNKIQDFSKGKLLNDIPHLIPGIWVNGNYLWLHNGTEKVIYEEKIIMKVKQEQLHSRICFSTFYVSNHSNEAKEITVMAMHHFSSLEQDQLTFVSPTEHHIFHHTNQRIILINGQYDQALRNMSTVIPIWKACTDQIWSSIEKGSLRYHPMVKGPAASIRAIKMTIPPHETSKMNTWTIAGSSKNEIITMEKALLKNILAFPFEK